MLIHCGDAKPDRLTQVASLVNSWRTVVLVGARHATGSQWQSDMTLVLSISPDGMIHVLSDVIDAEPCFADAWDDVRNLFLAVGFGLPRY